MVVKAIINAIGKSKPKPIQTERFLKNPDEARTLLEEAQQKIEKIESDKPAKVKTTSAAEITPGLAPYTAKTTGLVKPPKPSKQTKIDEFKTEEQKILDNAELSGNESEFFNFNKINTTDDIRASIEAMARTNAKAIKKRTRGTVTWKETNAAAELATLTGQNANSLAANLLKLRPGSALNATEIEASKRLLISQHKKLSELSKQMKTETGDNTKVALEFAQQHALTAELTKVFLGVRSEAGRALNILKQPIQDAPITNLELDALNRKNILMNLGGKEQIQKIAELYDETPGLINKIKFTEKSYGAKTADALVEIFLNNILFGVMTHVKNVGGNFIFKTLERTERKIAARMYGGKTIDSVAEYEDIAQAFGERIATDNMWRAFSQQWKWKKVLRNPFRNTPGMKSSISGTKFESPVDAFSGEAFGIKNNIFSKFMDVTGTILTGDRIPYRFLQNADNYFKNAAYQSEIYAQAFRETLKQIKMGTLTRKDAPEFLARLVTDPENAGGKGFTKMAYDKALERTFQTPLGRRKDFIGDAAETIQSLKTKRSFKPLNIFTSQYFTFLRTPTNITGSAWERLPVANRLLKNYRTQVNTPGAVGEIAKAKAAVGWGFLTSFGTLGYFGIFSGTDKDIKGTGRDKYQLTKAANRQPKSFRMQNFLSEEVQEITGLQGSQLQLSLNGFEPVVFMASMAADVGAIFSNIQQDWDGWENIEDDVKYLLSAYALAFGENILNSTFMNGAGRLMDFIQNIKMSDDWKEPIWNEGKKLGSGLVPYTMFLKQFDDVGQEEVLTEKYGLTNADDFRKLNIEFKSMVQKFVPGFENDLFFDYDWLGDEVPKFTVVSSPEEHPINKEAIAVGYQPKPVRKKFQYDVWDVTNSKGQSIDLDFAIPVSVKLNETEYAHYARHTGKLVKQYLTDLLKDPDYINEPNKPYKLQMFKDEVALAKQDARDDFIDSKFFADVENRAEDLAIKKWKKQRSNK